MEGDDAVELPPQHCTVLRRAWWCAVAPHQFAYLVSAPSSHTEWDILAFAWEKYRRVGVQWFRCSLILVPFWWAQNVVHSSLSNVSASSNRSESEMVEFCAFEENDILLLKDSRSQQMQLYFSELSLCSEPCLGFGDEIVPVSFPAVDSIKGNC